MIYMSINTHDYDNDVRVMTGAFYPGNRIVTDITLRNDCELCVEVIVESVKVHICVTPEGGKEHIINCDSPEDDRKVIRNMLKRRLYDIYSEITGRVLPWGTLTGIRPVKIPLGMIEKGYDDNIIKDTLNKEYYVNDTKAELSIEVAHREHKMLEKTDYLNGYSLYIGIPFCPTTCLYCSFTSYPLSMYRDKVDEYLDALIKELTFISGYMNGRGPDTIYIGGGTPTTLTAVQSDRLISSIEELFDLNGLKEFTVEAGRPDSIDIDKLKILRKHGIDRISINPQTMNQKTLDLIGRRHTVDQVVDAFNMARECGFGNINMDLIVGLPGENKEDVRYTLDRVGILKPDSLTVHSLAIKRAAALNIFKDKYEGLCSENTDELMDMTYDFAESMGMKPYYLYRQKNMSGNFENVGFARKGAEGLYNILIMEEKQTILAAGANAQTKIVYNSPPRVDRIENVKSVDDYIRRTDEMIERKRCYFNGKSEQHAD